MDWNGKRFGLVDLTQRDKQMHLAGSAAFALFAGVSAMLYNGMSLMAMYVALFFAVLPGLFKEVFDHFTDGNRFDWLDMEANLIGAAGMLLIMKLGSLLI